MRILATMLAVCVIGACATSSKMFLPDGREGYAISCDGQLLSWGTCMKKASDLCGARGYDVFTQNAETGALASATPQFAQAGTTINREMIVGCR